MVFDLIEVCRSLLAFEEIGGLGRNWEGLAIANGFTFPHMAARVAPRR